MKRYRNGDPVIVIAGNDKGVEGTIKAKKGNKVIVSGVNKRKKHMKGDRSGKQGQIVEFEAPINGSNIAYCVDGKPVKLRARFNKEGKKEIYVKVSATDQKVIRTN